MSDEIDGGPAFPMSRSHFAQGGELTSVDWVPGMTLRDYFAAKALAGIMASPTSSGWDDAGADEIAACSYRLADAMLAARKAVRK